MHGNAGKNHPRFVDITNQKHGQLNPLEFIYHTRSTGSQLWLWKCECDCGEICFVTTKALNKKPTPQTSCKKCADFNSSQRRVMDDFHSIKSRIFRQYERGAIARGYTFELSFDLFKELISQDCHYCGSKPKASESEQQYTYGRGLFVRNGIDRITNSIGYVSDNVVACCYECNRAKLDMNYDDFISLIKRVYKHLIEKSSTTIERVKSVSS